MSEQSNDSKGMGERYFCNKCNKFWVRGDIIKGCLVMHPEGQCCHYNDTELNDVLPKDWGKLTDAAKAAASPSTDTNTSFKKELEQILKDYHDRLLMTETAYDIKQRNVALTSIINLVDKVIGEDEYPKEHFPTYLGHEDGELAKKFDKVVIRDRLRQEQRAIIRGKGLTFLDDFTVEPGGTPKKEE